MKPVILCVDDEKVVLDSLTSQLKAVYRHAFEIERASGVEEAFEVIEDIVAEGGDIRLIISDWLMPPHRGDAFLIEVHKNYPEVKMIMLSGQADEEAVERVKQLPTLIGYLRKPWEKEEILGLIEVLK
jgi:DNA-binding NtrC family response regulator